MSERKEDIAMQKTTGKAARPYKGRSLIDFPLRYVVVDIETTGMSIDYFITQLTGISNAMVAEAPDISNSIAACQFFCRCAADCKTCA